MPNYNNGKIYKIINSENKVIYIGSTTEKLCRRYSNHKHKAIGNKIILLENYPCNSREELIKKEQELIEQFDNLLNKNRAFNSEEYNKEYFKEYYKENNKENMKVYYEENKNKITEKAKVYYEENKDKILEKAKVYYKENKEKSKVYYKVYREKFKDELSEKAKIKVICECGSEIRKDSFLKHNKSKKHIKLMESK